MDTYNRLDTDFYNFQKNLFYILRARGVYLADLVFEDLSKKEKGRLFALTNTVWQQLDEYEKR